LQEHHIECFGSGKFCMNMRNELICRCQCERLSSIPDCCWGPEKFLL